MQEPPAHKDDPQVTPTLMSNLPASKSSARGLFSFRRLLLGSPLNPMDLSTRHKLLLAAFLAWVGLGADGLSSANYGPEEAYIALGPHTGFGLFVAIASAVTVFIIALGYSQVIELFPSGGGGYRVATRLLGSYAGLLGGTALIIDYVLTITISIASGADALFSLLPVAWQGMKLLVAGGFIMLLAWLNLRGMKESIKFLMPVFMAFFLSHGGLVLYGLISHANGFPAMVHASIGDARGMIGQVGWVVVASIVLRAYSLGAGTYTGIEAVSNNVHVLAEPRVRTGKLTMLYMAVSLSFLAAGITLMYILWGVKPVTGQTLNAVTFRIMTAHWSLFGTPIGDGIVIFSMVSAAGILFVAANTGMAAGPVVLANMAADDWLPRYFSHLSSRLVTHAGIVIMTILALVLLFVTRGAVNVLVVLYSINVFITFALCLLGLTWHWLRLIAKGDYNFGRLFISGVGFVFSFSILIVLVVEKFALGGWISLTATALLAVVCLAIRHHYRDVNQRLAKIDQELSIVGSSRREAVIVDKEIDHKAPTAVLILGSEYGAGMHTLLWIERMFPGHYKNYVFLTVGEIDAQSYGAEDELGLLKDKVAERLQRFEKFCRARGLGTASYYGFGTDVPQELVSLAEQVAVKFSNIVFFAPKLMLRRDNWIIRILHNQTALSVQRHLHLMGLPMMILPMNIE
jgi:amino acid transporter